ncbi:hypothetical protein HDU76_010089, partial [Blyttiomyces sp. JEL0837]
MQANPGGSSSSSTSRSKPTLAIESSKSHRSNSLITTASRRSLPFAALVDLLEASDTHWTNKLTRSNSSGITTSGGPTRINLQQAKKNVQTNVSSWFSHHFPNLFGTNGRLNDGEASQQDWDSLYSIMRLILPHMDRERMFGMREPALCKALLAADALDIRSMPEIENAVREWSGDKNAGAGGRRESFSGCGGMRSDTLKGIMQSKSFSEAVYHSCKERPVVKVRPATAVVDSNASEKATVVDSQETQIAKDSQETQIDNGEVKGVENPNRDNVNVTANNEQSELTIRRVNELLDELADIWKSMSKFERGFRKSASNVSSMSARSRDDETDGHEVMEDTDMDDDECETPQPPLKRARQHSPPKTSSSTDVERYK